MSYVNKLRHQKFLERFSTTPSALLNSYNGVDMSLLPPCRDALRMLIKRANFQALIWYSADVATATIPQADGHGWHIVDGKLEIKWTNGFFMPQELVEILVEQPQQEDDDEEYPEFQNPDDFIFEADA